MRILVITHSYYPANDPRAFRWGAICEHWAKNGIVVDVVCAAAKIGLPNSEQINGVNVFRINDPSQKFRAENLENYNVETSILSWKKKIKNLFYRILKKIVLCLRWPDFAWLWMPRVYRQTRDLLRAYRYDGIVSVALPFSSHVVVLCLGKKRNNIPWVCDYGDPFSFLKKSPINNYNIYKGLNRLIEQKVMRSSRKISVTTLETAENYIDYLKVHKDWFHLIPPLVTNNFITLADCKNISMSEVRPLHLIFAGTLYKKIRNPRFLLELLAEAKKQILPRKLVIHFYGPTGDCQNEFETFSGAINDWVFLHGSVDKSELLHLYAQADVLVNIGNLTSYQAPSKIIEYMSTGLPILNITSISNDSSIPILEDYPATLTLFQGACITNELVQILCKFLNQATRVNISTITEILKPYQCNTIADSYLELLTDVTL